MSRLKDKLFQKIVAHRHRTARLVREFGKVLIDQVTIEQCIGGARDIRSLVTDISYLDAHEGIRFRGKSIPETFAALPKAPASGYPTVEAFWYFLLTGDIPAETEIEEVLHDFKARANVPYYVYDVIRSLAEGDPPDGYAFISGSFHAAGFQIRQVLRLGEIQQAGRLGPDVRRLLRLWSRASRKSQRSFTATSIKTAILSHRIPSLIWAPTLLT
jgi:citrate synthase